MSAGRIVGGIILWIVGFFLGLFLFFSIIGAFFAFIVWAVFFLVGIFVMLIGDGDTIVVHNEPGYGSRYRDYEPREKETKIVEKIVVKCPKCGAKNEEYAKFCNMCASPLGPDHEELLARLDKAAKNMGKGSKKD
jgi:hypothetical protein